MIGFVDIWNKMKLGASSYPLAIAIPATHLDPATATSLGALMQPRESYFQVQVNQLFLAAGRKWLTGIAPMVLTLSEFTFDGKPSLVPSVVGPGKLKDLGIQDPAGMIYRNTRVAGLSPYVGGEVSLAVVLCEVPVDNVADRFLRVLESTSQAFDFGTMVSPYLKMTHALLDGLDALFGLQSTKALTGWKQTFDPDGGQPLAPGFFALVSKTPPPSPLLDPSRFWVKQRELCEGATIDAARPYRGSDFVLFSIVQPPNGLRSDLDQLPIEQLWRRVRSEAVVTTEDGKRSFQANWTTLEQSILLSPDLTEPQREVMVNDYWTKAIAMRERAVGRAFRDADKAPDENERIRARSLRAFEIAN